MQFTNSMNAPTRLARSAAGAKAWQEHAEKSVAKRIFLIFMRPHFPRGGATFRRIRARFLTGS